MHVVSALHNQCHRAVQLTSVLQLRPAHAIAARGRLQTMSDSPVVLSAVVTANIM